jgi:hypothetical protein
MQEKTSEKPLNGSQGKHHETVEQLLEFADEKLVEGKETALNLLKKYPLESMLVGFGIGCLLGSLIAKKK